MIGKKELKRFWAILFMMLAIGGCAGKQEQTVSVLKIPQPAVSPQPEDLSRSEYAVFQSTGQIDNNVPDEEMKDIARQYKYYLGKGRKSMCAMSKQSEQYIGYAKKVFRDQGMPEELANLAIVESGYKPEAVSRAGAAGAWQFMPQTGLNYGLTQDAWVDERFDPWKATEAAAQYLRKLYNDFGDWPTAIAAYNAGEGKIARAKAMTGANNFFEVKAKNHILDEKAQLKDETKNYVPKFMAVSKIMRNLEDLGFEGIEPEKSTAILRFTAGPGTDLKDMSRACNMPWEEFIAYNRHHKRSITCTDKQTNVYVPAKAQKLASNYLCTNQAANYAGWKLVKVASSNDSLEKISNRTHVPLQKLLAANPGTNKLKSGQIILAPGNIGTPKKEIAGLPAGSANMKSAPKSGKTRTHSIKPKETLYSIAKKYGMDVQTLMAHNSISEPGKIRLGQNLSIPEKAPVSGGSSGSIGKRKKSTYIVKTKDNLWKIAKMHNISVEDLKRWNGINEKNLRPGASLVVSK